MTVSVPNPNIETALEHAILAGKRERVARDHWYASSLGQCLRKQVAERAGFSPTNPPDARGLFKMMVGTVIGKEIQALLEAEGYLDPAWHEKHFTYKSVTGKVDGYTDRIEGGAIVEIKTSDDRSITKYQDMPEHYLWQGMFYCLASGIRTLLVFQVGKNQGITRHRVVYLDAQWEKSLNEHIGFLDREWTRFQERGGRVEDLPDHLHNFGWEERLCSMNEGDDVQQVTKEDEQG